MLMGATPTDEFAGLKRFYTENCEDDLVIMNVPFKAKSFIMVNSPLMINGFVKKEISSTVKAPFNPHFGLGFFDKSDDKALHRRAMFKKFLSQENICSIIPNVHKVVSQRIRGFREETWSSVDRDFKQIDVGALINDTFADIVDLVMMSDPNSAKVKVDGMRISEALIEAFDLSMSSRKSRLSVLSF